MFTFYFEYHFSHNYFVFILFINYNYDLLYIFNLVMVVTFHKEDVWEISETVHILSEWKLAILTMF